MRSAAFGQDKLNKAQAKKLLEKLVKLQDKGSMGNLDLFSWVFGNQAFVSANTTGSEKKREREENLKLIKGLEKVEDVLICRDV